jgi:hypothetical protein
MGTGGHASTILIWAAIAITSTIVLAVRVLRGMRD